jgi:hypothetical protein
MSAVTTDEPPKAAQIVQQVVVLLKKRAVLVEVIRIHVTASGKSIVILIPV